MRHLILTVVLALAGCGAGEIGEECEGVGSTDDCVDGALCTNEGDGSRCRQICVDDMECPAAHHCNGVSGTSTKSCQPD